METINSGTHEFVSAERLATLDGQTVTICGAVHRVRRVGQLCFIVIRDGKSLMQCKLEEQELVPPEEYSVGNYVEATGVCRREAQAPHGAEIELKSVKVLSVPNTQPPFSAGYDWNSLFTEVAFTVDFPTTPSAIPLNWNVRIFLTSFPFFKFYITLLV